MSRRLLRLILVGLAAVSLLALSGGHADSQKKEAVRDGTKVQWEGWSFNWSLRRVEGLVLTDVFFKGRKVLNYAGIVELLTAYDQGEPRPLDLSQNGMGEPALPLLPGLDCASGEWCKVYDGKGKPVGKGGVPLVMMHEERTGPNYLGGLGRAPGKTLVLWSAGRFTGGQDGYTFIVRWKFRDDGALIPEVGATGVPQHLATGDSSTTGAFIGLDKNKEKVFAPSHVHNFLYRLDFAVDGEENTVEEFNCTPNKAEPGKAACTWTPLLTETGRSANAPTFRSWRVVNYKSKNVLGHPRSYQLLPGSTGTFRGHEGEKATHTDLWVTLYKPKELPRSPQDPRTALAALPVYANGEAVADQHVVLWYWLCFHHLPRSEDWRQQPMVWKSFELMPRDFLDSSPLQAVK